MQKIELTHKSTPTNFNAAFLLNFYSEMLK